jgi:hypothetical protein
LIAIGDNKPEIKEETVEEDEESKVEEEFQNNLMLALAISQSEADAQQIENVSN